MFMKCQCLFSGEKMRNIWKYDLFNYVPSILCVYWNLEWFELHQLFCRYAPYSILYYFITPMLEPVIVLFQKRFSDRVSRSLLRVRIRSSLDGRSALWWYREFPRYVLLYWLGHYKLCTWWGRRGRLLCFFVEQTCYSADDKHYVT